MKGNRTGVWLIMAHLIITILLILGYLYTLLVMKQPDETLKMAIMTILGYWFGALGKDKLNNKKREEV